MPRLSILLLLWATFAASGNKLAQADELTVFNAGFEDPALPDGEWIPNPNQGWFTADMVAWELGYYDVFDPGEWFPGEENFPDQEDAGVWNPDAGSGFTGSKAFAGENTGWALSAGGLEWGLSQIVTDTLQANTKYVLGAQVGNAFYNASDVTADYRLELLAGNILLATDSGASPHADSWESHSLTYKSGPDPAQHGKQLEIRLIAVNYVDGQGVDGYQVDFDEVSLTAEEIGAPLIGDYNENGELDEPDLNLQAIQISNPPGNPTYDLDQNGVVDFEDRQLWVGDLKGTWIGDADLDGEFNSNDFVQVFTVGKYETGQEARWSEGDWDGNGIFDSSDFVVAFTDGGYEQGPRTDVAAVAAVPEPGGWLLVVIGLPLWLFGRHSRRAV